MDDNETQNLHRLLYEHSLQGVLRRMYVKFSTGGDIERANDDQASYPLLSLCTVRQEVDNDFLRVSVSVPVRARSIFKIQHRPLNDLDP